MPAVVAVDPARTTNACTYAALVSSSVAARQPPCSPSCSGPFRNAATPCAASSAAPGWPSRLASPKTWVIRPLIQVSTGRSASTRPSAPRYPKPPGTREPAAKVSTCSSDVRMSEGQRDAGVVQHDPHVGEEPGPELAVDDPVVEGQAEGGDLPGHDLPLVHPRLPAHGTEGEDRRLPGVEDRGAGVDAEDADVGDGDRAAGHVGGCGLPGPGGRGELV